LATTGDEVGGVEVGIVLVAGGGAEAFVGTVGEEDPMKDDAGEEPVFVFKLDAFSLAPFTSKIQSVSFTFFFTFSSCVEARILFKTST